MNKYSKLSEKKLLDICKLINPKTKWEFNQRLDNDGKGTDDCVEFISNDDSCIQFNIHQKADDEIKCYLNGNWDNDKVPSDKLELIDKYLESGNKKKNIKKTETEDDFDLNGLDVESVNYFQLLYKISIICFELKKVSAPRVQVELKSRGHRGKESGYTEVSDVFGVLVKFNIISEWNGRNADRNILVKNKKELNQKLNEFIKIEKIKNQKDEKEKIKNESMSKLKKFKEQLDLELISQEEYDNYKQELRKFIMDD